jgi:hypothetical protein
MGKNFSKNKDNVKIPDNYNLIKIISYNVRLIFGSPLRANKLGYYLTQANNHLHNDVICLQGIYDYESREIIINILKNDYPHMYTIPDNTNVLNLTTHNIKKCGIGTLILSKYEVINYMFQKFDENAKQLPEHTSAICVNINVNGNIISLYDVQLQSDYKNIVSNRKIRSKQLDELQIFIEKNISNLHKNTLYNKTNIHLITGSLNILGKNVNTFSSEYMEMMQKYNFIDIYKLINNNPILSNNRLDYVMLYLPNNINIDENTQSIFEYFKINFIDISIQNIDYSDHFPIETLIMFKYK